MKSLVIEARGVGCADWCVRNRLGELNYRLRDHKIAPDIAVEIAKLFVTRWNAVEPYTEFRVAFH